MDAGPRRPRSGLDREERERRQQNEGEREDDDLAAGRPTHREELGRPAQQVEERLGHCERGEGDEVERPRLQAHRGRAR
jgi:hypothetical protein